MSIKQILEQTSYFCFTLRKHVDIELEGDNFYGIDLEFILWVCVQKVFCFADDNLQNKGSITCIVQNIWETAGKQKSESITEHSTYSNIFWSIIIKEEC